MEIGHHVSDLTLVGHGFNPLQLRLQGGESCRISLRLIGASGPVIADLLLHRRALARWLGRDLKYGLVEKRLVPQLKLPEGVPENFVWRHGIVRDPAIARVLVEIGARIDRSVNPLRVE